MARSESLAGAEKPVPESVALGYARVSTMDQSLEAQRQAPPKAGC